MAQELGLALDERVARGIGLPIWGKVILSIVSDGGFPRNFFAGLTHLRVAFSSLHRVSFPSTRGVPVDRHSVTATGGSVS